MMDAWSQRYRQERVAHWDTIARQMDDWEGWGKFYHQRLKQIHKFQVPSGLRVLEIGCARGDLLAALKPSDGVGVDFSSEMISRAVPRHPELSFYCADAHDLSCLKEKFDFVILSDLANDLWDVQKVFEEISRLVQPHTRLILNSYSRVWEAPLTMAAKLGLAKPVLFQNWLTVEDINNMLNLSGFETIRTWPEILLPLPIPIVSLLLNKVLVKLKPFSFFALTNLIIARPRPSSVPINPEPMVSVVIAARNEAGNIPKIFERVPQMGRATELVFVEGHSKDDTFAAIEKGIADNPHWTASLYSQKGVGKGDAIRLGFERAMGDILMILDADLTVPPEDLPRFYDALNTASGEFINGVRLVYPMEERAMRMINLFGNKFFGLVFSWLLGQPIKDTLCGTKVLWKRDYDLIADNRAYFGDFDPFGDFDLIFGAAKLNLKIVDMPLRYRQRVYGDTNIERWRHGWLLLRMVFSAARKLKFI